MSFKYMSKAGVMSWRNPHTISVDRETWQSFNKLQELMNKPKAQILREMINDKLKVLKGEVNG